ncbi:diaminopimelate epimerase [Flavisolibacter tropicus]|uniref:Diaminopimelate epimerase n=1 Tax=Flavisolibacter tropicus TaxID=1492898 RepID=A0A172TTD0_9BACT|nr:diaminopimelate epimerase [Flavisolibacter tropicus]ANE50043.1 diaminopimelate epimerase [Flavisolibacter tropicus]
MKLTFYKYQGTGNDFVILDNRNNGYASLTKNQINFLCDRRFGIGADGLMLLNSHPSYDFEMKYYNADGGESTMCGNGGRCLVKFANDIGILKESYHFIAIDGEHEASVDLDGTVSLKMNDVNEIQYKGDHFILNTGSPHYVQSKSDVQQLDVYKEGHKIRYSPSFEKEGINVNFVEQLEAADKIFVRTYERGVEDETYSCGTGVTAAALVSYHNENGFNHVDVLTKGGQLSVEFDKIGDSFKNIWLTGPAEKVFEGTIALNTV